jgi:hypothetical protein
MTAIRQKYYFGGEASWALGPSSPSSSSKGPATNSAPLEIITEARSLSIAAPPGGESANYPGVNTGKYYDLLV